MGVYVNPAVGTKEEWLAKNGIRVEEIPKQWKPEPQHIVGGAVPIQDCLHVCLMNNAFFSAAGVAWCEREFKAFNNLEDYRPKTWYIVPVALLLQSSDLSVIEAYK